MSKVSKVVLGNDTVMDITDSTVNANNLLSGEVAYGADGERVVGEAVIPTVNNGILTIKRNGVDVQTFTANQSTNVSANILVPTTASDVNAIATSDKGAANGVAELDANGKVPSSQLPSYVDDVLEYDSLSSFPSTGEAGKIYVAKDTNKTYRWSGTAYVEISPSLALGETSSTAYRGDRGKTAYDHSQTTSGNPHNVTKSEVGLGNVPNVSTNDQTPTFTTASTRANITSGEKLSVILGKISKFFTDLKTVAFTGAYSDLTGTPTIPTVNNGTLTVTQNGTSKGTFTANQSGNATIALTDTTYSSKAATSGGTDVSLVTTGEKYTWNNKVDKVTGKGLSTNDYTNEDKAKVTSSDAKITHYENSGYLSRNLYDEDYTIYDGTIGSSPVNYYRYFKLEPNTQYTLSSTVPRNNTQGAVLFIISGKSYSITTTNDGVWNNNPRTITTDANGYATIVWKTQDGISPSNYPVQLEKGSVANDYTVYAKSNIELDATKIDKTASEIQTSDGQFTTVTGGLMQKCLIDLEPIQSGSGTPSPSNVRPISGHTQVQVGNVGKNWLSPTLATTTLNGITCTNNGDGTYTLNGTATADTDFTIQSLILPKPIRGKELKLVGCPVGGSATSYRLQLRGTNFLDVGNGYVSSYNLENANNLQIRISSGTILSNKVFKPMLTLDTSATYDGYEPYNGYTHIINLGGTYYGGKLDAVSGKFTVTHGFAEFDGSSDENWSVSNTGQATWYYIISGLSNVNQDAPQISNQYLEGMIYNNNTEKGFWIINSGALRIRENTEDTVNNFKSRLASNPLQVCYELATPQTIQLTPTQLETLVGQNDVFAPLVGQSVEEVEYREVLAWDDVSKAFEHEWVEIYSGTVWLEGINGSPSRVYLNRGENMGLDASKGYEIKVMINVPGIEVYTDILPYDYPMNIIFSNHSKSESGMYAKYKLMAREIGGTNFYQDTFYETSMVRLDSL